MRIPVANGRRFASSRNKNRTSGATHIDASSGTATRKRRELEVTTDNTDEALSAFDISKLHQEMKARVPEGETFSILKSCINDPDVRLWADQISYTLSS